MTMGRVPGFGPADKKTQTRNCRDCYSDRVVAVSFSPHLSQPVRRCWSCWLAYYMPIWKARHTR